MERLSAGEVSVEPDFGLPGSGRVSIAMGTAGEVKRSWSYSSGITIFIKPILERTDHFSQPQKGMSCVLFDLVLGSARSKLCGLDHDTARERAESATRKLPAIHGKGRRLTQGVNLARQKHPAGPAISTVQLSR